MPTPIFDCAVIGGKLKLKRPERFQKYVSGLQGEFFMVVKKKTKKRSKKQNRYYRGVIIKMIAEDIGYYATAEKEEFHNWFRYMILKDGIVARSTTDLNTAEMEDYEAKIRMWASEFRNLVIPLPNEIL